ncbi:MAG: hypothetical protein ACXIVL_00815 [Oceanicaulis sp.]
MGSASITHDARKRPDAAAANPFVRLSGKKTLRPIGKSFKFQMSFRANRLKFTDAQGVHRRQNCSKIATLSSHFSDKEAFLGPWGASNANLFVLWLIVQRSMKRATHHE